MRSRLAEIDQHSRICFHGKAIPPPPPPCGCGHFNACRGQCKPAKVCCQPLPHASASGRNVYPLDSTVQWCNTRSMVETSHANLRQNVCIASKPRSNGTPHPCTTHKDNYNMAQEKMHDEVHANQKSFLIIRDENKELKDQIRQLSESKVNLKEKVDHLQQELQILVRKSSIREGLEASNIAELISYLEAQRDIYRNNVNALLNKLDPERAAKMAQEMGDDVERVKAPKVVLKSSKTKGRHVQQTSNNIYSRNACSDKMKDGYCYEGKSSNDKENIITPEAENMPNAIGDDIPNFPMHKNSQQNIAYDNNLSPEGSHSPPGFNANGNQDVIIVNEKEGHAHASKKAEQVQIDNILEDIIRGNDTRSNHQQQLTEARAKISKLEAQIDKLNSQLEERHTNVKEAESDKRGGVVENTKCFNAYLEENNKLKDEMTKLQSKIAQMELNESICQNKSRQQIADLRATTDTALEGFQRDLRTYETELENLRSQITKKDSHLRAISSDKDALQNQLDEKTIQLEHMKSKLMEGKSQLVRLKLLPNMHILGC